MATAAAQIPYMAAYGTITRTLEGIKTAATPDRFTQDFLATKLAIKGGSAQPVIPFLKRTGFLNGDGSPTNLYTQFRNDDQAGAAAAKALRSGYEALYQINEYAHELDNNGLAAIVVQATGWDKSSSSVKSAVGSFKALKAFADFDAKLKPVKDGIESGPIDTTASAPLGTLSGTNGVRLAYTINLNLPATSDISVFNAIFKSLKDHLL